MVERLAGLRHWLMLACAISVTAWAADSFTVRDIRIEGLARIAAGTVFNYLPIKIGDSFDETRSAVALRELFKTGLFSDVKLERDGDVLVVTVVERPAIAEIQIVGNEDISSENLLKGLKDIGVAAGEVFDQGRLDKVEQELRRQYFGEGKYGIKVSSDVRPLDGNRVAVTIKVNEGKAARIREVNIVGNKAFDEDDLLKQFSLSTPTLFSWITGSDQYSKQKLAGDLETLRSVYLDNGFINFTIDSTQVSISPNKEDVYVTINVTEGKQFRISEVKLAGELIVPEQDLVDLVQTRKDDVFSRKEVTASQTAITERLGEEGYAFANVNAIPDIAPDTENVTITYFIDPGKRVYVRRVTFTGNTKTRDEVLRREMRQFEGAWISTKAVERSKTRLLRLGYFTEVNVETPAVAGSPDQVDVNFTVVEKPSGNLLLGLGFSQSAGVIFNTEVSQENFLGSGKRIDFAFNNSEINRRFVVGYTNPYWTEDGISRGFQVGYRETNAGNANIVRFENQTTNITANFGIPISEFNFVNAGADYERTKISSNRNTGQEVADFVAAEGNEFDILRLRSSFTYDTRNRAILPDRGTYHAISADLATPVGDLTYYKFSYDARWLYPLAEDYTLLLKGDVGYVDTYGETEDVPFFENFYAGGPRSVRGYEEFTLGPRDSTGRALGGNFRLVGNAEVILPIPFISDFKSVRLTAFYDVGNVFGADEDFSGDDLRMAVGLSGLWVSPFGVLSISVAQPFRDQAQDRTQPFQFTFGSSF
jgi:outer membrane protein insertion porin family